MIFVIIVTIVVATILEGSEGKIDLRYLDESVEPCDNFYQYACGNFKNYHSRNEDQRVVELFTIAEKELVEKAKEILEIPRGPNDPQALQKAKAAYRSCADIYKTDHEAFWYYKIPEKKVILDIFSKDISLAEIGKISAEFGIQHLFSIVIRNSDRESFLPVLFPDSWEDPEMIRPKSGKTYDEVLNESFRNVSRTYKGRSLGDKNQAAFDEFLTFAINRTRNHSGRVLSGEIKEKVKEFASLLFEGGIIDDNITLPMDVTTLPDLQDWTDETFRNEIDANWVDYIQELFKPAGITLDENFYLYLGDTSSVYGILNLLRKTDPEIIRAFITVRTIMSMAPDSDREMREAFEKYYKSLGLEYYERSEYCARKIVDVTDTPGLSFAVTYDFVNYHFNLDKISKTLSILEDIQSNFIESLLPTYDWLDQESRDAIARKLNYTELLLGYPDFIQNGTALDQFYENVEICEWDNYGNAQKIRAFRMAYRLNEYMNFENHWAFTPFEVNAYAVRQGNRIKIPLAILHSSFLDDSSIIDPIFDYSRLGSILAHEFVHHIDNGGINYNELGEYSSNFLTNFTLENFYSKTQCFRDQYSKYYVEEIGQNVDGEATLNENLADNGGLRHAFDAFKKLIPDLIKKHTFRNFTPEQLFFINYATSWCSDESDDYLTYLVEENDHSPNRFRVIGTLSNMKEFSEAFQCQLGSRMNPENKCILW